ncbi:MAG: hypothetical protein PHR44_06475 [Candidatus Omnitrophica bacterium]|nr:hypothetical protein [Candidatus Omnitrophota bacterium]
MAKSLYIEIIVDGICGDIKKAENNGIVAGSVILTLSAIDAMAFLAMPLAQKEVKRKDYINWVEKYMKTDLQQSYQYRSIDIYGARCGIVHRYGVESRLSETKSCKIFVYHNGSEHIYNPSKEKDLVLISIPRFTRDFFKAVKKFMIDIARDKNLKLRTDSRITKLFKVGSRDELQ